VAPEIDALVKLAYLPNISVKMSAVSCYSSEPFPHPALHPFLESVLDAFGAERVFFGSDLSRLQGGYRPLIELFTSELAFLQPPDLEQVMGSALEE
jgi:predicted TIM-barrel fold metal-dependent hydrolase